MKHKILYGAAALALVVAAGFGAVYSYVTASYKGDDTRVNIPAGVSADSVECIIRSALGDGFGSKTVRLWKAQGGTPATSHGSYLVREGDEAMNVARAIAKGRQTPVRLTFNNLRLYTDLAARIGEIMECDSAAFMAESDSILGAGGFRREEYAAAVLPDTYEFYWTASPEKIVNTLAEHHKKFWTRERTAQAESIGLSPTEVHTVASIAEEETAKADERGKVARLYINRLNKGMPLQADPTVKFALQDFALRRITGKELTVDSPYNTYKNKGLPPGPIRIAEAATLEAVLQAPAHRYLYMCAKSDFSGYHDFAEDYSRHRINAARYHRALNERGIK